MNLKATNTDQVEKSKMLDVLFDHFLLSKNVYSLDSFKKVFVSIIFKKFFFITNRIAKCPAVSSSVPQAQQLTGSCLDRSAYKQFRWSACIRSLPFPKMLITEPPGNLPMQFRKSKAYDHYPLFPNDRATRVARLLYALRAGLGRFYILSVALTLLCMIRVAI